MKSHVKYADLSEGNYHTLRLCKQHKPMLRKQSKQKTKISNKVITVMVPNVCSKTL